jgi:hypothetical protein
MVINEPSVLVKIVVLVPHIHENFQKKVPTCKSSTNFAMFGNNSK